MRISNGLLTAVVLCMTPIMTSCVPVDEGIDARGVAHNNLQGRAATPAKTPGGKTTAAKSTTDKTTAAGTTSKAAASKSSTSKSSTSTSSSSANGRSSSSSSKPSSKSSSASAKSSAASTVSSSRGLSSSPSGSSAKPSSSGSSSGSKSSPSSSVSASAQSSSSRISSVSSLSAGPSSVLSSLRSASSGSASASASFSGSFAWGVAPSSTISLDSSYPTVTIDNATQSAPTELQPIPKDDKPKPTPTPPKDRRTAVARDARDHFRIRGSSLDVKSYEVVRSEEESSPLSKRVTMDVYHGCCADAWQSIWYNGLRFMRAGQADEFSYKGGFYLTDTYDQAYRFIATARNCENKVIIHYRLNLDNLNRLSLGDGTSTGRTFWNAQWQIADARRANRNFNEAEQYYYDRLNQADVLIGSVPLAQNQIVHGGPVDPFRQIVCLTTAALNSLQFVEHWEFTLPAASGSSA